MTATPLFDAFMRRFNSARAPILAAYSRELELALFSAFSETRQAVKAPAISDPAHYYMHKYLQSTEISGTSGPAYAEMHRKYAIRVAHAAVAFAKNCRLHPVLDQVLVAGGLLTHDCTVGVLESIGAYQLERLNSPKHPTKVDA